VRVTINFISDGWQCEYGGRGCVELSASVIGNPDGIDTALMCHWYVFGAHYAFEDDLEMCVSLDPLDVLPGQVVSYLVHE
jgi:hypothetical protein